LKADDINQLHRTESLKSQESLSYSRNSYPLSWNLKVDYHVQKISLLFPIKQMNSVHTLTLNLFKIHLILSFYLCQSLPNSLFPSDFL